MRWTQTLIPTMKEVPADAEVPSHQLMLRAGLVRQLMAGAYSYLPLGYRALRKAEAIVREEMERAGAIEVFLPALQPIDLFERTGRKDAFGNVLINFEVKRGDRKVHLALGPTHEEVITDLISKIVSTYRQLPFTLFQIQTKFRNEERPRFGVLRTSEFLMKDAYSFSTNVEQLDAAYDAMYAAYCRIYARCGLEYLPVEAESGPIGGDASHEFMVPAANGEDQIIRCPKCSYSANMERADTGRTAAEIAASAEAAVLTKVDTPGVTTIEQVCGMLNCDPQQMVKTLIYIADEKPVAVLVRGDHEANEGKVRRALRVTNVELADEATIKDVTGAPVGFAGPVGISCDVIADHDVALMTNAITGANKGDVHYIGVNVGRDYELGTTHDLRDAGDGDPCPRCEGALEIVHGIEVGHVFKLGTKYTEAVGATVLDEGGKAYPVIMGSYGIGVDRMMACIIEAYHDENGIIWPVDVAPFVCHIVVLSGKQPKGELAAAEDLKATLESAGLDVLLDDRDERAGVKFNDADLIGCPVRITVGARGLVNGTVEIKQRKEEEKSDVAIRDAVSHILGLVRKEA